MTAITYGVDLDLGGNHLLHLDVEVLTADPTPELSRVYYNSISHTLRVSDGATWADLTSGTFVASVSGTAPIVSSGGTAPAISIVAATGSVPGSMSAADKAKLDAAASAATASVLMLRDASGRAQVVDPSVAADIATKGYVDTWVQGAEFQTAVQVTTATNQTKSGLPTIDGYTMVNNDRILLTGQTAGAENGPWVVHSGAWTRPTDYAAGAVIHPNRAYFVNRGTTWANTAWTLTNTADVTVDTTATTWTQFSGLGDVTVTAPILKSGNTLSLDTAVVARHAAFTIGDGAATSYTCNHAFGTRDVQVQVYRNSTPWDTVLTDVERTDTNNIAVKFNTAPASNAYRVVVTG